MKILFTGGGTAGHIFPIVAIIREIKKIKAEKEFQFFYIGPRDDFAFSLLSQEGVTVKTILAGKIRRYFSLLNIIDIFFNFPIGIIQSFFHIFALSPDLIFSKGGYGSLPTAISGWVLFTPIFLHESDISAGLANRIAAKFSLEIFTAFPVEEIKNLPEQKMLSAGNPIRSGVLLGSKERARTLFSLSGEKPVLLILGGSQGAQRINDKILLVLAELLDNFELIHQTGQKNFNQVRKEAEAILNNKELKKYYHVHSFLNEEEIANAYQAADLIISRAGANTIFEIAAVGKPSILVPLAGSAQNHQVKNAYEYLESGAAIVMEEPNFTPHFLSERLKYLFSNEQKLKDMSERAKEFSKPEAAKIIANYIVSYLNQ